MNKDVYDAFIVGTHELLPPSGDLVENPNWDERGLALFGGAKTLREHIAQKINEALHRHTDPNTIVVEPRPTKRFLTGEDISCMTRSTLIELCGTLGVHFDHIFPEVNLSPTEVQEWLKHYEDRGQPAIDLPNGTILEAGERYVAELILKFDALASICTSKQPLDQKRKEALQSARENVLRHLGQSSLTHE